jgi:hypothetical protein
VLLEAKRQQNTKRKFKNMYDSSGTFPLNKVYKWFWWGNLRERDYWGDPDIDGRVILRWTCRKWGGVVGTGWSWLRIGTGGVHL